MAAATCWLSSKRVSTCQVVQVTTRTFRVEAEGVVDDRVAARLTAIVQKRTDVDPPSVVILEMSGAR